MAEFKTVKQIIHDSPLMRLKKSEEEIFVFVFKTMADRDLNTYILNSGEAILDLTGPQLTEEEYFALFGRHLEQNAVDQYQYSLEQALVDSVCAYTQPELSREKLIEIVKGKENSEVKELFNNCLGILNTKFKTQVQPAPQEKQEEAKQPVQDQTEAKQQPTPQPQQSQQVVTLQSVPQQAEQKQNNANNGANQGGPNNSNNPGTEAKDSVKKIKLGYTKNGNNSVLLRVIEGNEKYGNIKDLSNEDLANAIIPYTGDAGKEEKTFKEIIGEIYNQYLEGNEVKSFVGVGTSTPGIKTIETSSALPGIIKPERYNDSQDGRTIEYKLNNSEILLRNAQRLKYGVVSILDQLLHRMVNNDKINDENLKIDENLKVKDWIKKNHKINGKPATVEDTVTQLVEFMGIKNELDAKCVKDENCKNPDILVRAFRIAGLDDSLKDNIKEMKDIVKEKGLEAGYNYALTLYKEIKPLLTNEQNKVFDSLNKTMGKAEKEVKLLDPLTSAIREAGAKLLENQFKELKLDKDLKETLKTLVDIAKTEGLQETLKLMPGVSERVKPMLDEKQNNYFGSLKKPDEQNKDNNATQEAPEAENSNKIPNNLIEKTVKQDESKWLENQFRDMGLYKPTDLINSPLNETVRLICDAATSNGLKIAVEEYIPNLLAHAKFGLTEKQTKTLETICKNYGVDKNGYKNHTTEVDSIFISGCEKLKNKMKKIAAKNFEKAIKDKELGLKSKNISTLKDCFKQNKETSKICEALDQYLTRQENNNQNSDPFTLSTKQCNKLAEIIKTYRKETGNMSNVSQEQQITDAAEKQENTITPELVQPQQGQNSTESGTIAEPSVSSSSTGTKTTQEVPDPKQADETKHTINMIEFGKEYNSLVNTFINVIKNETQLNENETKTVGEYYKNVTNFLQQRIKLTPHDNKTVEPLQKRLKTLQKAYELVNDIQQNSQNSTVDTNSDIFTEALNSFVSGMVSDQELEELRAQAEKEDEQLIANLKQDQINVQDTVADANAEAERKAAEKPAAPADAPKSADAPKQPDAPKPGEHNEGNQLVEQPQNQNDQGGTPVQGHRELLNQDKGGEAEEERSEPEAQQQPEAADANAADEERQSENDDSSDYQAKVEMATKKQALQNRYDITEAGLNLGALRQVETTQFTVMLPYSAPEDLLGNVALQAQATENAADDKKIVVDLAGANNAVDQLDQDKTAILNK